MLRQFSILLVCGLVPMIVTAQQITKRALLLMGSSFEITIVAPTPAEADTHIDAAIAEIQRIEQLISSWDSASETSQINRYAGEKPVTVAPELLALIQRAIAIAQLTDGAFDISYASMDRIWKFDGTMQHMPTKEAIAASVAKVGFQHIEIDTAASTVYLRKKGMKIGFGAIGKGYAADRAKALMLSRGVTAGIINASGDMTTWGSKIDGTPWQVAITNPMNKNKAFALLPVIDGAVVTSGDYEKYVTFDGNRYTHIIDPRTGYPATGIVSVTVFAPKAELADALATSIFVMGRTTGINRVNQLKGVECIVIDAAGAIHTSAHIHITTP